MSTCGAAGRGRPPQAADRRAGLDELVQAASTLAEDQDAGAITGGFTARLRSQECQYGEDAAMVVRGNGQVEAGEDAAHVPLDGLGAEEQPIADGLV